MRWFDAPVFPSYMSIVMTLRLSESAPYRSAILASSHPKSKITRSCRRGFVVAMTAA
jgi:hypothetical protein